jgi:hypothetical protein
VKTVALADDSRAIDPITVDMSAFLPTGDNQLEFTPSAGTQSAMMRFSSTHCLSWPQAQTRNSDELRLGVQFDHLEARPGQPIHCFVKAERVGFRGYGMMLAEIGIPLERR